MTLKFLVRDFLNVLVVTNDARIHQMRASVELYARFADPPVPVDDVLNLELDQMIAQLPEIVKRVQTVVDAKRIDLSKLH